MEEKDIQEAVGWSESVLYGFRRSKTELRHLATLVAVAKAYLQLLSERKTPSE